MDPRNLVDWLALSLLPGFGPLRIRAALERFGDPGQIAFRVPAPQLCRLPGISDERARKIVAARAGLRRRAERELRLAERLGIRMLLEEDADYPAALREIHDRPVVLFQRGRLPEATTRVAVIGSRRATALGRQIAHGMAAGLAARGIEVVSGGARGIDTEAHRGALEEGGRTVAIIGSGLVKPYPSENKTLFEQIGDQGAVLSEFGLEEPPRPENFPRRNRLISGLAAAVVVVEAAAKSGTLSTAKHALEQGREVMAVPGPVTSRNSVGCHRLIRDGAKLVQNIEDILEELSPLYRGALRAPEPPAGRDAGPDSSRLTDDERAIVELLRDRTEAMHLDGLADLTLFGMARLHAALFGLELVGAVEQLPGGYYLLRPAPGE